MTQCLSELFEFEQKEQESIETYYDQFNDLVYRCSKYSVVRSIMEFNIMFFKV